MRRLFSSRGMSAAATGILVLLIAGGGYAIAGGSGTINACAQKHGHHLLYTGKCKKGDKKLSWGVQGRPGLAGATGPVGPKGATGTTGATGPSAGFSSSGEQVTNLSDTTVVSLTLPAGSFIINGKVSIADSSAEETTGCYLLPPGVTSTSGAIDESFAATDTTSPQQTMSLVAPLTTSGGAVTIVCFSSSATTIARSNQLTAIQVGSVTGASAVGAAARKPAIGNPSTGS
jgi:hypothetical protein